MLDALPGLPTGGPAAAQAPVWDDVDLELVLLADASGSIDFDELGFQRQGCAAAMADPMAGLGDPRRGAWAHRRDLCRTGRCARSMS